MTTFNSMYNEREPDILEKIQNEVYEWSYYNFGNQPSYRPLLGIVEEVGELCHAHLKHEQNIRRNTNPQEVLLKKYDAIGDVMIYLMDYAARENINILAALIKTWDEVKKRDWKKYPTTGKPDNG